MIILIQDLCNRCKINPNFISPSPYINKEDNSGLILLEDCCCTLYIKESTND